MRFLIIMSALFYAASTLSAAADSVGIVAVVDDQVISTIDLNDRMALVMGTTGIPDTPETRARLAPQILHQLVDEKLQMEDASRASITITDAKLHDGVAQIEKQSGKAPGSLEQYLESKGLSKASFYAQVRAQMAWAEIVMKKIRPKIRISDQEVARFVKRKEESPNKSNEVLIASIQLPVDAPANEPAVHKLADKLAGEIKTGASFEAVATQFSSSTGGTKSAEPFWVELSQLDPAIAAAIAKIDKGGITEPVRTGGGYQILKLMDARQAPNTATDAIAEAPRAELAYKQIQMTLKPDAKTKDADILLQQAKEVAKAPGKCTEKTMAAAANVTDVDYKVSLARDVSTAIAEPLRDVLMKLKVGGVSDPVVSPQEANVWVLCERMDLPPSTSAVSAANDAAREVIYKEKLELEAQKYLRNLRREAFIEVRGINK